MSETITRLSSEAEKALSQGYETARAGLPGNDNAAAVRQDAFAHFTNLGLPSRRVESWHYSDLRAAMRTAYPLAPAPDDDALYKAKKALADLPESGNIFVIVDGVYVSELSRTAPGPQFSVMPLADALATADEAFVRDISANGVGADDSALALNAALMTGGIVIDIEDDAVLGLALHIVNIATRVSDSAQFTRSLVRAGRGAKATIIERHISIGEAGLQANSALTIVAADNADIHHVFVAEGSGEALLHVNSLLVTLGTKTQFSSFGLLDGGAFMRRQLFARLDGADARLDLSGVSLIRGKEHIDTTLVVEHVHPGCASAEYFKQIVEGSGTGVFQGKISVAPEAQKTDGAMKSQTILLSDDAAMYNKPELEIFADDVLCGHGATCGSLDEDQLFYTMARGVPRADAEALLLEAFGADAMERIENEAIKEELAERLRHWLAKRSP